MTIATRALLMTTLALMPLHGAAAPQDPQIPEVRSPQNGARIGAPGDPHCPHEGFCDEITARAWIPPGRAPFFAVAPKKAPGRMWVQPPIAHVNRNGTFSSLVHLGKLSEGAGEEFEIFALACSSAGRFVDGEVIGTMPDDCEISDAVEVYRER